MWGNAEFRFELSNDRCMIRCAQGRSAGAGVRPGFLPVGNGAKYLIHGKCSEEAKKITQTGLSRCRRLHVHFYE